MHQTRLLTVARHRERFDHSVRHLTNLVCTDPSAALSELTSSLQESELPPHIVDAIAIHYETLPSPEEKALMIKRFEANSPPTTADSWKAAATFSLTCEFVHCPFEPAHMMPPSVLEFLDF